MYIIIVLQDTNPNSLSLGPGGEFSYWTTSGSEVAVVCCLGCSSPLYLHKSPLLRRWGKSVQTCFVDLD